METKNHRPVRMRRPILIVEVSVTENFGERNLELICSIPGREGTVTHSWPFPVSGILPNVAQDVYAYIGSAINAGILSGNGAQDVLPFA